MDRDKLAHFQPTEICRVVTLTRVLHGWLKAQALSVQEHPSIACKHPHFRSHSVYGTFFAACRVLVGLHRLDAAIDTKAVKHQGASTTGSLYFETARLITCPLFL